MNEKDRRKYRASMICFCIAVTGIIAILLIELIKQVWML
jgi:hypothetical protein